MVHKIVAVYNFSLRQEKLCLVDDCQTCGEKKCAI